MSSIFMSPSRYIQGAGELHNIGSYAERLGDRVLCLVTKGGYKRHRSQITASFANVPTEIMYECFKGECSKSEIRRLVEIVNMTDCDVIIGVGGGKILDTAKAVAFYVDAPVIICPTIASTDAPCSALSVIYSDDGAFEEYLYLSENPNMVVVDTEVITKSPVRMTVSGMGDAMATYFEARACAASGAETCAGGEVGLAALGIAKLCCDTLMAEGVKAKKALEAGACTTAVERVIEANIFLSGIGFESGGLACAHAIHNGLTILPECHHMNHGEKVNFGTLTQLVLENIPEDELSRILNWMTAVGLPVTFGELGITDTSKEHLMPVVQAACAENETMHNMPFKVTEENVYNAMLAADNFGRGALNKN